MALMLGQLHYALRAGNVPDDRPRAAAEEVANYGGKLTEFRLEMREFFREADEGIGRIESDLGLLKWTTGSLLALTIGRFALQWQILLRLPS